MTFTLSIIHAFIKYESEPYARHLICNIPDSTFAIKDSVLMLVPKLIPAPKPPTSYFNISDQPPPPLVSMIIPFL